MSLTTPRGSASRSIVVSLGWITALVCGAALADDRCTPTTTPSLPQDATLAEHAGNYRLTLVRGLGSTDARTAVGTLVLRRSPAGIRSLGPAATPLHGTSELDVRTVGAQAIGDTASADPRAPGVLVLESGQPGERDILLRFGARANRRDMVLYDAGYLVLRVGRIVRDGFFGTWESSAGSSTTGGYFCARKDAAPLTAKDAS